MQGSLMIFEKYAGMKNKYRGWYFWRIGCYVITAGKSEKVIAGYIRNVAGYIRKQSPEDISCVRISMVYIVCLYAEKQLKPF